jgi:hypothetical protein
MPRAGGSRLAPLAAAAALATATAASGCRSADQLVGINPFLSRRSAENSDLNLAEVQKAYSQSLSNDHLAVLGSQLTRELILNNYIRFMMASRASATQDILQGNFTSFGYFNVPSKTARSEYCRSANRFAGAVVSGDTKKEAQNPACGPGSSSIRIPLGYSLRGFAVPSANRFAQRIDLAALARASQKPEGALWSDLDPSWPKRRIRWLFSSQSDFLADLRSIGIRPPSRYQLAATYSSAYQNLGNHTDNLLLAPTNPSLSAALKGARFRILPVQTEPGARAVAASADNREAYPPQLVKGLYLYLNTASTNSCVIASFADFMLNHNAILMHENNAIPLPQDELRAARSLLLNQRQSSPIGAHSPTLCKAYAEYAKRNQHALQQPVVQ